MFLERLSLIGTIAVHLLTSYFMKYSIRVYTILIQRIRHPIVYTLLSFMNRVSFRPWGRCEWGRGRALDLLRGGMAPRLKTNTY